MKPGKILFVMSMKLYMLILVVFGVSCALPNSSSSASITISIGGVLPQSRLQAPTQETGTVGSRSADARQTRAFIPQVSASLRVRITNTDTGTLVERSFPLTGSALTASVDGLPVNKTLAVEVAALDASGTTVTGWEGLATLQAGVNSLPVVLAPPATSVIPLTVADTNPVLALETHTLAAGALRFYEIKFAGDSREWHLIADSQSARWLWMDMYDADWRRLPAIAADPAQGWVVTAAGGNQTVRIAVANTVLSPGYPAGAATYMLQARQAYFTTPEASAAGTGRSTDPTEMGSSVELNGISIFLQEGTYAIPGDLGIVLRADIQLYGGFSAASWQARNVVEYPTIINKELAGISGALNIGNGSVTGSGRADGLRLLASAIASGSATTNAVRVTDITTGKRFIITNSRILGSRTGTITGAYSTTGLYMGSAAGLLEVAASHIEGGAAPVQGTINANSYGISIFGGTVYVHSSDIDGGYVSTGSSSAGTWGIYANGISNLSLVAAGNRIWGGRVEAGSNGSSATGIYVYGPVDPAAPVYIANNVISAGYDNSTLADRLQGIAVLDNTGEVFIVGNTVDGGSADLEAGAVLSGIRSAYDNRDSDALANLLYVADGSAAPGLTKAAVEADFDMAYFRTLTGNTSVGLSNPYIISSGGEPVAFSLAPTQSNNETLAALPSTAFRTYRPDSYTAADWFAGNNLRPAQGFNPGARVEVSAYIGAAAISSWPALGLDAAGTPRPATGLWYRGAYEP